jgi:hypothetical protein
MGKRTKKAVDWEVADLGRNPEFLKLLAAARARMAAGRSLSLGEVKKRVKPSTPTRRKPEAR